MSDLMDVSCKSRDNQHASSDTTKVASIAERTEALSVPDVNAMHDYISQFFKDGKIVFQEPKLRPENHVEINAKIVRFRQLRLSLEQRAITEGDNLSQISAEYYDLVAALVQDSDESLSVLTMRLNDLLSPFNRYEEAADCYSEWIERTIKQVAHRERYGLQASILNDLEGAPATVPLNLSVFRWESKNISIFPQDLQTAIEMRRYARRRMTETVMNVFHSLPAEQQISLLNTKHRKPHFTVTKERVDELVVDEARKAAEEAEKEEKRKKKEEEKRRREEERKKREEEKRVRDEERKKREEEKRLREEERKRREDEKKKKEQSQLRLTSLFTKATFEDKSSSSNIPEHVADNAKSNYFPPFFVKEHVRMHKPVAVKSGSAYFEKSLQYSSNYDRLPPVSSEARNNYLQELKANHFESTRKRGIHRKIDLRTFLLPPGSSDSSVYDLMNRQNAQQLLRMKLLQFYEDVRPAYYGTWTKKSKVVTGRTPFARDEQSMDYEHDSEAEWEPEGEGEDIQSGEEDEDDPTADLADGDDAGWLVPEGYLSDSEGVDTDDEDYKKSRSQGVTLRPASRKHLTIRQVVIGPLYEDVDGHVEDDALKPYETKMIIDCGDSYDPFYVEPVSAAANAGKGSSFTEHHTTELVNIIAGKAVENIPDLVSEAKSNWLLRDVPKRQIEARIKDLAVKEKRGSDTKPAWYIKETN